MTGCRFPIQWAVKQSPERQRAGELRRLAAPERLPRRSVSKVGQLVCSFDTVRRARSSVRGAMLLEVILALTILLMGMSVIGIQLHTGVEAGYYTDRLTQAITLAQAKVDQLDSGAIQVERELYGDFGKSFPGYFWRFRFEPHDDIPDMFQMQVEILYGPPLEDEEPSDIEDAVVVTRFHAFRPTPPTLNLQRDFGFTDDQLDELTTKLPPSVVDPTEISPAAFAQMSLEELAELLPVLLELFGQGYGISSDQIQQAINQGLFDPKSLPTGAQSLESALPGARKQPQEGDRP